MARHLHDTVTIFDRWSVSYDECSLQPLYEAAHLRLLQRITDLGPAPRRILDVGCGTGQLLRRAGKHIGRALLVGIDVSGGMLRTQATQSAACDLGPTLFAQAAVESLPFPSNFFDVVTSTMSYRHWNDRDAGLREVRRVLRPGGAVLIADAFDVRMPGRVAKLAGRAVPQRWRRRLNTAGLQPVHIEVFDGFGPVPELALVIAHPV